MEHPITPPPELGKKIRDDAVFGGDDQQSYELRLITAAYRAGADRELEACAEWLVLNGWGQAVIGLRAARRPKPPSLKKQALKMLDDVERFTEGDYYIIRCALEQLDD